MAFDYVLTQEQIDSYHKNGFLKITDIYTAEEAETLVKQVREIQSWPDAPEKWMNYYELNKATGKMLLCRTENFTPYNNYIREMVTGARIMGVLEQLTGEPY
ncbi:hypothetical protein IWW50_005525, partial [Coemansia erecta]